MRPTTRIVLYTGAISALVYLASVLKGISPLVDTVNFRGHGTSIWTTKSSEVRGLEITSVLAHQPGFTIVENL